MEFEIKGKSEKRTLIISHEDMDGLGSAYMAILLSKALRPDNSILVVTSMTPTDEKTFGLYKDYSTTSDDLTIVTDRAINYYSADVMRIMSGEVYIFDHHISAKQELDRINSLPGVYVYFDDTVCATKIITEYYLNLVGDTDETRGLEHSSHIIDMWDTFKWKNNPNDEDSIEAVKWNQVSATLAPEMVLEAFIEHNLNLGMLEGFELFYRLYQSKVNTAYASINRKNTIHRTFEANGKSFKVAFIQTNKSITADKYSIIADRYLTEHEDISIVVFVDDGLLSVRGRDDSIVSALEFTKGITEDAGGHKNACGASLCPTWLFKSLLTQICIHRFKQNTIWWENDHQDDIRDLSDRFFNEVKLMSYDSTAIDPDDYDNEDEDDEDC